MSEKHFSRKEALLSAALDEFTNFDYERASLNTIIKSSGISKGVFYYHFENKEALYLTLLKTCTDAKWDYINLQISHQTSGFDAKHFDSMDLFDKFMFQAELGLQFAQIHPKYHKLGQMFAQENGTPIYQTAMTHLHLEGMDVIRPLVLEAMKKGELKDSYDESFIILLLNHLFSEFDQIFGIDASDSPEIILQNLRSYLNFIKYGLKA